MLHAIPNFLPIPQVINGTLLQFKLQKMHVVQTDPINFLWT